MLSRVSLLTVVVVGLTAAAAPAQKSPAEYDVKIRYQIYAFRNERIVQFQEMVATLESAGFKKAPGPDDEAINSSRVIMTGTIGSIDAARKLLGSRHVQAVMITPKGAPAPGADDPVRVQLELRGGLTPEQKRVYFGEEAATREGMASVVDALGRYRVIADNARVVLKELGFREAAGYDDRGHIRLVGQIPAGKLDSLLEDLREHPKGAEFPAPFKSRWPLAFIEVMPETPFPKERPLPTPIPAGQETITPELRAILADEAESLKPIRMEVILARPPRDTDRNWQRELRADVDVEGRLGPVVTVYGRAVEALNLAALPNVSTVRLPRSGQPRLGPTGPAADPKELLQSSGVEKFHQLGRKGKGYRVVVVDGAFRGWEERLKQKELPAGTKFIDLTAERHRSLLPDDEVGDAKELGHGTRAALVASKAAPEAQLILVRVAPESPYQLQMLARAINGELPRTEALDLRREELEADRARLEGQGQALAAERRRLLDNAPPRNFDQLWADYLARQEKHDREEGAFQCRFERWYQLTGALQVLKGAQVVASPLVWNEGHPADGGSALSRFFDDRPFKAAMWFQAAGDTRGQSWSGPFRDVDNNGVMEFSAPGSRLNKDRWSNELNFLAWQPQGKPQTLDVPENTTVRVSIQWREPHDPEFWQRGEDAYRYPLANLHLVLLKQTDPTGKAQPADDLEVVAESFGLPQRLDNKPDSATYEQTVEVTLKEAGRYVLRVEGRKPRGLRPVGEPSLPVADRQWELKPRVFVQTLAGPGRVVFADYAPLQGNLGMPGDALGVITVGAAGKDGKPQPDSGSGPPHNIELAVKPDVLAYTADEDGSTSAAVSLSAGVAASALSGGAPRCELLEWARVRPGGVLRIPDKDAP